MKENYGMVNLKHVMMQEDLKDTQSKETSANTIRQLINSIADSIGKVNGDIETKRKIVQNIMNDIYDNKPLDEKVPLDEFFKRSMMS